MISGPCRSGAASPANGSLSVLIRECSMTPQRTTLTIASVFLVVQATVHTAQVATGDHGFVSMALKVPASVNLPDPSISAWRSFVDLAEMRLEWQFTNVSKTPVWIYSGELLNAIQFRVDAEGTVPVTVRWLDEMNVAGEPLPVLTTETVLLEPEQSVAWTASIRRTDGQVFGPGTYRITINVRNARNALREGAGQIWSGRAPHDGLSHAIVRIEPPTTAAESGLRYILEAEDKVSRNEFTAALNAYSRAADIESPWTLSGMLGMAHMYRRLNRLSEAIALYEKASNGSLQTDRILAQFLALAHIAGGQDVKAIDVLRNAGLPEAEIATRMQELRERVKVERSQPER